jgi:hypothetical protein
MEALGVGPEKQDGGIGRTAAGEEIEVLEQGLGGGVGFERETALAPGGFEEPVNVFCFR